MGRTVGVIVEYNPLHNGHAYHLAASKQAAGAETVVAVMSGHWLQRGEPALMSKWARAEAALLAGVDLVLELPVVFSAQPAERFAFGAVSALEATGVVDAFCFGSESGDLESLRALASRLAEEPDAFAALLRALLKTGAPYPAAYADACADLIGSRDVAAALMQPNNSLGFHYLLAHARLRGRSTPLTIRRAKAGFHDVELRDDAIASATAIRKRLLESKGDPAAALEAISPYAPPGTIRVLAREWEAGRAPMHWERFKTPLFHRLLTQPASRLAGYREVTEGLERRIKKTLPALGPEASVDGLLEALKTKRYTRTKLQRMLTAIYLEHAKVDADGGTAADDEGPAPPSGVPYLRVLGFTEAGRALLSRMKRSAAVPVVTSVGANPHPTLALDCAATAAYALGYASPTPDDFFADYYRAPVRISFGGSEDK